jgi:bacteriocin-like protein
MEAKLNDNCPLGRELDTDELENVSGGTPGGIQAGANAALNQLGTPGGIQAGAQAALNQLGIK